MPKGSSCKARGCTSNKTDNPELSFHSFPKNKERFKIWCDLIKRPDLNHSKVITNRMSMRVCSLHFEDRMYMSPNNKSRLIWCAVPKPVTDGETSNLAESVDSKAALANKVEAQERQTGKTDSTVLAQPLPLAKGSKKFDWSLTLDEDVIVKEENMMDQDNQLDLSAPPSPEEANSPTSCVDTKEGIIKHDHTGRKCLENMKSSSQCQEDTTTVGATFGKAEASEPNETETESSSFISADGFNHTTDESSPNTSQTSIIPKVPSGESRESSPTRKNGSSKGIVYEAPSSLLSHVKEEPFRSTRIVLDNDAQVQKVTSKTSQLLEDTEQHCYPHLPRSLPTTETCQPITSLLLPNTVTTTASATTTTSSQSNSSVSATITQPPQQKITLSPSLGNFHSHKTVDSSMKTKEPKLIQVKSSVPDTGELSANREELLKKLAYDACGDEQPIVVDEDDVSIVDEREFSECEKDCQCIKCEEKAEKVLPETAKPPYQVRRTYSGPIKRKIVKTKDGGKRTFMILNKASLKVLQAKGLIQPLKNFADSQPPVSESLLPLVQSLKNKTKIQYNPTPSFDNTTTTTTKNSGSPVKVPLQSLSQKLSSSNKAKESIPSPQASSQTPVVVTWSATNGTDTPSFTFTIQLPPGSNQRPDASSTPFQIVTPPVFIGGSQTESLAHTQVNNSTNANSETQPQFDSKFSEVGTKISNHAVSQSIISSTPKSPNYLCSNTSTSDSSKHTSQTPIMSTQFPLVSSESPDSQIQTSQSVMETINDLEGSNDSISSGLSSSQIITFDETTANKKPETKSTPIGFASGPCILRKGGVKMYRYVNMPDASASTGSGQTSKLGPKSTQTVRWVALPTVPISSGQSLTSDTLKHVINSSLQKNSQLSNQGAGKTSSSSDPLSPDLTASIYKAFPITPAEQKGISSVQAAPYKSANKELKKKYARLLNKHRQRYHLLLKKYKSLESKFAVVEDAGTPEQVIRDAKNFLSEEHVLFLESQMFLRNRPGTGNRFSKKFMKLMIEYYKRSAAGYRFLRTIFTIPSVKTVQKWLSKPLQIREEKESDPLAITSQRRESGTRNERESSVEASGSGLRKHQSVSKGEHGSGDRRGYSSTKFSKGRLTPDESDMEEGSSEEYDSEESGLEEMEDEEGMEESENSSKRLTGQTSHGSNEEEITIEWEEEPWPSVVME